jgi:hypothetical protein
MTMILPAHHILPLAHLRRLRLLNGKGRVLVRPGQMVEATDVIAEAPAPGQHLLLDVRKALGVQRVSEAEQLIERQVGERVEKGDILAQTRGLFARILRAPVAGQVVAIYKGQILLETQPQPYRLLAGLPGQIAEVFPERGAIVETHGALIQGVWGNQQNNHGLLTMLAETPDAPLKADLLDLTLRGSVIVGGTCDQAEALKSAAEIPVRGIILGSLSAPLLPLATDLNLPVILLEGIGQIPINRLAFQLLNTNQKREVYLQASWNPALSEKPEIVIPLPAEGKAPEEAVEVAPGRTVRIILPPHAGVIGKIIQPHSTVLLRSGQRIPAAEVELENSQRVTVPLFNLDIIA